MKELIITDVISLNHGYNTNDKKYKIHVSNKCPICNTGTIMDETVHVYSSYISLPMYFADANSEEDLEFNITGIYKCSCCKKVFVVRHKMRNNEALLNKCKYALRENEQKLEIIRGNSPIIDSIWTSIETALCKNSIDKIQIAELENKCKTANAEEISQGAYPYESNFICVNDSIKKISPKFYDIYNQCLQAKYMELNEIYGMGLRKALEQLVTDYIINTGKDTKENVTKKKLHERIEKYFSNMPETHDFLMAAKWIGNDETHYINENTQDDRRNLELFILDALDYITKEIRHQKAVSINNSKTSNKT